MVAINEAYRVLADPGRRAVDDRAVTVTEPLPDEPASEFDAPVAPKPNLLSPSGPARVPWRFMAIAAVIGSIGVLISSIYSRDPKVEQPDGILRPGSCVAFEPNGDAREVACGRRDPPCLAVLRTGATRCFRCAGLRRPWPGPAR